MVAASARLSSRRRSARPGRRFPDPRRRLGHRARRHASADQVHGGPRRAAGRDLLSRLADPMSGAPSPINVRPLVTAIPAAAQTTAAAAPVTVPATRGASSAAGAPLSSPATETSTTGSTTPDATTPDVTTPETTTPETTAPSGTATAPGRGLWDRHGWHHAGPRRTLLPGESTREPTRESPGRPSPQNTSPGKSTTASPNAGTNGKPNTNGQPANPGQPKSNTPPKSDKATTSQGTSTARTWSPTPRPPAAFRPSRNAPLPAPWPGAASTSRSWGGACASGGRAAAGWPRPPHAPRARTPPVVDLAGARRTAHLAHALQGGRGHLVAGGRRLEVVELADVSAHPPTVCRVRTHRRAPRLPPAHPTAPSPRPHAG